MGSTLNLFSGNVTLFHGNSMDSARDFSSGNPTKIYANPRKFQWYLYGKILWDIH